MDLQEVRDALARRVGALLRRSGKTEQDLPLTLAAIREDELTVETLIAITAALNVDIVDLFSA